MTQESTEIKLEPVSGQSNISIKIPKRVIKCSDGVFEEFSDDEVTEDTKNIVPVDMTKLTWGPWLLRKALGTGQTALDACDYVGEGLASFFGITTPKYQFEILEYERRQAIERKQRELAEGWVDRERRESTTCATQPEPQMSPPV